ncbi:MAG TPA: tyrosine--tRNA ligase [Chloroflexi bacterium]|nr:tyrosine--tRNA ligase [Chloroflexota bacterium]|tara:strand:+ start:91 stop:1302 length:1212 start_codon:yes stop_codon:yes gene_type:complete
MNIEKQLEILMQGTEYGDHTLEKSMRRELFTLLKENRPLRVYCGYDPTATDLHLGHTITMRKLRQFQDFGHEVTFLIGDSTALIGDPSDKNKARPILNEDDVRINASSFAEQAYTILDSNSTQIRYNSKWLNELGFSDLIRLAQNFTIQQFLSRNNFANRIANNEPVYLHETFYALMQGYDAVAMKADVQVGGTDQLFNIIVAGRKLQQMMGLKPQVGIVLSILPGTDGEQRMSKSMGNHIPIATTADDMFGKIMSIPDDAMGIYFRLATRFSPDQIRDIENEMASENIHPKDVKITLASEITEIFCGLEKARDARERFAAVFGSGNLPDNIEDRLINIDDGIVDILVVCRFAKSKSEARRLISQGAVKLNGSRIVDIHHHITDPGSKILQVGKRKVVNLIVE